MLSEEDFKYKYLQQPITFLTEENLDKLETHCRKAVNFERGVEHKVVLELLEMYYQYQKEIQDKNNEIIKLQKENETLNIALNKQTINIRDNLLELQEKDKRINDLEFALLDMVMQFANRIKIKGSSYAFDTMGLSALELAFDELGFHEMYPVKRAEEKYKILEKQYFKKQAKEKEN